MVPIVILLLFLCSLTGGCGNDLAAPSQLLDEWGIAPGERVDQRKLALWASPYDVVVNDTLDLFVHSVTRRVSLAIFRLGWYGGSGARKVWSFQDVPARAQPRCSPPFPGPVQCPWTRTLRVAMGPDWVSGVYLVKAVDLMGRVDTYPFVVTDHRASDFTVVVPQFTWQAYNWFGGANLYSRNPDGSRMHSVSFERPYRHPLLTLFDWELNAIRWLEQSGYDLTYVSDLDLSRPTRRYPTPRHGLIFVGHDEYWTWGEYELVYALRESGTNLMFLSGNNAYWNVRLLPGSITGQVGGRIMCYKGDPDPGARTRQDSTVRFRDLGRPENGLYGIMYAQMPDSGPPQPLVASDTALGPEAQAFLNAGGLKSGDAVPGGIAWEGDQIIDNGSTPPGLQVVFRSRIRPARPSRYAPYFYSTFFVAKSGAGVFASGSNRFAALLSDWEGAAADPRIQRLTGSVLDWMLRH